MKAIIIAAGACTRLRPLTNELPKCMLKINGKSILQHSIELFRNNEISDISVIRGYKKEKINFSNITYFENTDYMNNNILHSLMYARSKINEAIKTNEDVVITYSDIIFENSVLKALMASDKPISAIVDFDWHDYYSGRTDHPIEEAENVIIDSNCKMLKIGKHIFTDDTPQKMQGEFIGLWKFTSEGAKIFLSVFDRLDSHLNKQDPFQKAKEWQKSYITDIFQEMINNGEKIHSVMIKKQWKEFDTVQDFRKAGGKE